MEASAHPGIILVSGRADGGEVTRVNELVGKKINSISACEDTIIALMEDGMYSVSPLETSIIKDQEYISSAAGKGFIIAQDHNRNLYSWGTGLNGQLGLGVIKTTVDFPCLIKGSNYSSVVCGQSFAIATDPSGKAYSWGENFSKQLALYTKDLSKMHLKNALVEDMCFAPRLIPFTFHHAVKKIACGEAFVVALLREKGRVYSWGAGETFPFDLSIPSLTPFSPRLRFLLWAALLF